MELTKEWHPPQALSFAGNPNLAEDYKRWSKKFHLYLVASGKNEKGKDMQVAVLLTCIGDDGLEVFNNFQWDNDDDKDDIDIVLEKFRTYCEPRKKTV